MLHIGAHTEMVNNKGMFGEGVEDDSLYTLNANTGTKTMKNKIGKAANGRSCLMSCGPGFTRQVWG